MVLYSPKEQNPTHVEDPDGRCMVRGCKRNASMVRVTHRGWFIIHYCQQHELEAYEFFGRSL